MVEEKGKSRAPHRWRTRFKRLGLGVLIILGLLAIFHRPLVFRGTKLLMVRLAKEQKLDLEYDIGGTIFTTLRVRNLRATPLEPGPVERLEIGGVDLRYSLIDFMRKGLPALLKELELRDAYIVIDPSLHVPRQVPEEKKKAKFPALFPEVLELSNLNLKIRSRRGDTELSGFHLAVEPARPGALKMQLLNIPGVRQWRDVSAGVTFQNRNLVLRQLRAGPEIAFEQVHLDGSRLEQDELGFGFEGTLVGGRAKLTAKIADLNETNRLQAEASISELSFEEVWRYLNIKPAVAGTLRQVIVSFDGLPEKPSSWQGKVTAQIEEITGNEHALGELAASVQMAEGKLRAVVREQIDAANSIALHAEGSLPENLDGFSRSPAAGWIDIQAPDVAVLAARFGSTANGDLSGRIDFKVENQQLTGDATFDSAKLTYGDVELRQTGAVIHFEKPLDTPAGRPAFEQLSTQTRARFAGVRWKDYSTDEITLAFMTRNGDVTLESVNLAKGANSASLQGRYTLPDDLRTWERNPIEGTIAVDAPELEAFVAEGSGARLKGQLKINGQATALGRDYTGSFTINGREIEFQGLAARLIDADVKLEQGEAQLARFEAVLDDKNRIDAFGKMSTARPYGYQGTLTAGLSDLAVFEPYLREAGRKEEIAGAFTLHWKGNGALQPAQHSGSGALDLKGGRFGDRKNLTAQIIASYTPQLIEVPTLRVAAEKLEARSALVWRNQQLTISSLTLRQQQMTLVEGSGRLPLDLSHPRHLDRLIPENQPLQLALRSRSLNLKTLFEEFGRKKPPVTGIVTADIIAEGTLKNPVASASVRARDVQVAAAAKLAPAEVALDLSLKSDQLKVNGTARQRQIQPISIVGHMPFDLDAIRKSRTFDTKAPIDLQIRMPRSSLAFIEPLAPAVRALKGTTAVDVKVGGTIAAPDFSGTADADIAYIRFKNTSVPPINRTAARITFTRDQATISRLAGDSAGGSFVASGQVRFVKLTEPVFDIKLATRNVLVMQNDNLTVRLTSNLGLAGPLPAATLTGTASVTHSRFFKDIEILPIGLPGRPAPKPPPSAAVATVSFANPPLRDWQFNVAIKTADPFLIQGNLANGRAVADLKLGGTGLRPWLDGSIRIEELMTSLPFSRLEVTSGFIHFSPDAPFVPRLDIRATSQIRDYRVNVYIHGPRDNPQAVFSSQPPLPQSEIVSLLATGTTTKELSKDPNVLAGRAALLVFRKYYQKFFKKGEPMLPKESLFGRAQFDVGVIDPKTGRESISVKVPLSDEWVLTSGVDVGGDFRGQIKYVLRFR